jgi:DNA modification methylase
MTARILQGDCLQVMADLALIGEQVDAIVTDPPYELGFMGKSWDSTGIANNVEMWKRAYDLLKPGGHLLAFSSTRTYHRMVCAIEDAGFEIRDQIGWMYGTGFPKSLDVSKAIDKAAGAEREVIGKSPHAANRTAAEGYDGWTGADARLLTAPATPAAQQWSGWGTALKPAWEPICVARKPLIGTVADNVLTHGTGALNIDACRIGTGDDRTSGGSSGISRTFGQACKAGELRPTGGRWPANVIHDGSDEVLDAFAAFGEKKTGNIKPYTSQSNGYEGGWGLDRPSVHTGDAGTAARFFYSAKASKADRAGSKHPTVKPISLMRYLCKLVTPPGGTVLDMFAGSGTTLQAAVEEGFSAIGIERELEYYEDCKRRLGLEDDVDAFLAELVS